jgi:hypothetical protein
MSSMESFRAAVSSAKTAVISTYWPGRYAVLTMQLAGVCWRLEDKNAGPCPDPPTGVTSNTGTWCANSFTSWTGTGVRRRTGYGCVFPLLSPGPGLSLSDSQTTAAGAFGPRARTASRRARAPTRIRGQEEPLAPDRPLNLAACVRCLRVFSL